jgi:hypothetical protein
MACACHAGLKVCQGAEGVLRISLGCFLFFFVMFLSTVNTRKVHDCRNSWHSEWWPAKLVLWLGLTAVTFLAPSPLVQLYGQCLLPSTIIYVSIQIYIQLSDLADDAGVRSVPFL